MAKKSFLWVLALLLVMMTGSAFAQTTEPIRIGAIFDLSGATGDVGTPYAEGVLAYVDYINSQGGIEGRPIELLSQDYAYSVETAETLYTQFVNEGAVVFLGWGTGDTEALRGRITQDEIPFISASYSDALANPAETPYNFLIAPTYSDQAIALMQYMLDAWLEDGNDASDMRVAFFHNDSPFGTSPLAAAEAFAEMMSVGGTLRVPMPRGATDFTAELQQADDFGVTHIIVQNVSSPAALLLRNVNEFFGGTDVVQFGCLNWCADELMVNQATPALSEGALGAIPFTPTTVEVPGQEAPREWLAANDTRTLEQASLHFTQGWAAMSVMVEGIRRVIEQGQEVTGPNIRDALQSLENFETGGLMPPITFTTEDHRGSRALNIYRVEDGVWVQVTDEPIDVGVVTGETTAEG